MTIEEKSPEVIEGSVVAEMIEVCSLHDAYGRLLAESASEKMTGSYDDFEYIFSGYSLCLSGKIGSGLWYARSMTTNFHSDDTRLSTFDQFKIDFDVFEKECLYEDERLGWGV